MGDLQARHESIQLGVQVGEASGICSRNLIRLLACLPGGEHGFSVCISRIFGLRFSKCSLSTDYHLDLIHCSHLFFYSKS